MINKETLVYDPATGTGDNVGVTIIPQQLPLRFDEVSSSIMYLGEGLYGALDNEAKWQIKKITITGSLIDIKNASQGYDQIWSDRASLTYV